MAGPYSAEFMKGDNSTKFCINIINDMILEPNGNEFFWIKINTTTSYPSTVQVHPQSPKEAKVMIIDDECEHLNCVK